MTLVQFGFDFRSLQATRRYMPIVSCLMPSFNRYPTYGHLVEEAAESFLQQDYPEKELLVCNDTPGQELISQDSRIRVFNLPQRLPHLTDKIQFLIEQACGDLLCRWDDDDISLPWRLSLSVSRLGERLEWRADNYWYYPIGSQPIEVRRPGNTHTMALWRREVLTIIGGYPAARSGGEDQDFNAAVEQAGLSANGEVLPPSEIFYFYRWGVSPHHLSGAGGGPTRIQQHYERIGASSIVSSAFEIRPHWRQDYARLAANLCRTNAAASLP
jgi:cellulose synthase/poly-beta-1,6-N-acetylglucosamine synthase-like glycosyltransferase